MTDLSYLEQEISKLASQESVNQLSKDLEKMSTQENLDRQFDILFERIKVNQRIIEKSLDWLEEKFMSFRSANTDTEYLLQGITTLTTLYNENGKLYRELGKKDVIILQKDEEIDKLKNQIQALELDKKKLLQKIETLEKQNEVSEEKVHEKEHDDYEIEM